MTATIILDNSINSRLLSPDSENPENNEYALRVLRQATAGSTFHVPTIWHYESAHVAAALVRNGQVPQATATRYLQQIAMLPIITDTTSHASAATAAFALSIQLDLSVYDAAYLELALRLGGASATNDKILKAASRQAGVPLFE